MKIYSAINDLGIESFQELKEFNDMIATEVSMAMSEENPSLELKWKDKSFTISLDSMDFIIGFNYGTACAFMELEKDGILKRNDDESGTD